MSDVTAIPEIRPREAAARAPRDSAPADHPLVQLTLTRFREFLREPEALFWVFIFPILLAAGLGLAFRNRPADVLKVATVTPELAQSLRQDKLLDVQQLSPAAAETALRTGKVALLAEPGAGGTVVYRYDNTNPEGRTARMLADRAVQRAAGRVDPVGSTDRLMREPGSRYIDFLIPGLLGMNLMGSAIWGMGFAIVDARRRKLMKRLIATPMPRHYYLLSFLFSRLIMLVVEVGFLLGFGVLIFKVPARGSLRSDIPFLWRFRPADRLQGKDDRGGLRPHEPGDDAHVDRLGRLLFGAALSRGDSAGDQGSAADRGHRRPARQYAARRRPAAGLRGDDGAVRLAGGVLSDCAQAVPLAVTAAAKPAADMTSPRSGNSRLTRAACSSASRSAQQSSITASR